jgi:hypothetical protein
MGETVTFRSGFLAVLVVAIKLLVISWIRNRYMDTPFLRAAFQVSVGDLCVFVDRQLLTNAAAIIRKRECVPTLMSQRQIVQTRRSGAFR